MRVLLFLILMLLATGCATKLRPTEFRSAQAEPILRINKAQEFYPVEPTLSNFNSEPNPRPILFVINKPTWGAKSKLKPSEIDDVSFTLRERLYRYILRQYGHPARVRYAYIPSDPLTKDYDVIFVDSQVTHAETGSGPMRFILGYGAGATTLQVEGSFNLKQTETTSIPLLNFAARQKHGAYPNGFMNTQVWDDAYCLKYATEAMIGKLTLKLPEVLPRGASPIENPGKIKRD